MHMLVLKRFEELPSKAKDARLNSNILDTYFNCNRSFTDVHVICYEGHLKDLLSSP